MRGMKGILIPILVGVAALAPSPALALCAVEGRLELIRLNLDEMVAFVLQVRPTRAVVPNAFHVERTPNGSLGDIPVVIQLLSLASPANATILAVGDLANCPDVTEIERARAENKAVYSGRLLRVFVKYR
jgi:hypothetical protein